MKARVLQEDLTKTLVTCSRFASSRVQLPILANVLLKTDRSKLLVSATNLEVSISVSVGAKVEEEGEITVPARTIADIFSNLNPGQVSLEVEKEILKIKTPGFESSISGMNASDFPNIPQEIGAQFIQIPTSDFLDALSYTLFAVSTDETRPILTGVLTIFKKGELLLVSTDGFRLSQKKIKVDKISEEKRLILPKSALVEVSKLSDSEGVVNLSFKKLENQVVFSTSGAILASRVIEGEFPDFERIIPRNSKIKVFLDKEEFLQSVKLASVFARDSANVVKLSISEGLVEVYAESSSVGTQKKDLDAKVEGFSSAKDKFIIAFNYRFLEDFLGASKGESVQVEFSDTNAPALFVNPEDSGFLHVIMPVRLQT